MQIEIQGRPSNSVAKLTFNAGEDITAEGGSMVAMGQGFKVETTTHKKGKGSIGRAIKRMFAGESFFLNHYHCGDQAAELYLAPTLNGDIMVHELTGDTIIVQGHSFLAATEDIDIDMSWQGLKNLFTGEGLFWLKMSGSGTTLINAFGTIYPIDVDGEYIVDTNHIVAFEEGLEFKLSKVGHSWLASFFGGEGFVCKFKGKGRLWCQSHSPGSFGKVLGPLLTPIEE